MCAAGVPFAPSSAFPARGSDQLRAKLPFAMLGQAKERLVQVARAESQRMIAEFNERVAAQRALWVANDPIYAIDVYPGPMSFLTHKREDADG